MRRGISRRDALALLSAAACAPATACRRSSPDADAGGDIDSMHYLGLQQVARRLQAGDLSPVVLTRHVLDRIARIDPTLESYATVMADPALAAAARAEREIRAGNYRGPLHGVPIGVKDLCYTRGVRTMGGTAVMRDFVPDVDATVVSRLHDAGAVVLGKLNLTEGAMGGYHPDFGVPRNPWDTSRWPGLSSSGSGVATAAGLCFGAIGTDTGGSIRFPSSANGVVGLKPTYGRVSRFGVLALAESLDHVGPMARRVVDVAIMYDVMAGHDAKDATSLADSVQSALAQIGQSIAGLRIGIDPKYALEGIDSGQAASIEDALKVLAGLGAQIVDVQMPNLTGMLNAWLAIDAVEAVAAHAANFPSRASEYGPYFRQLLEAGAAVTPEQLAAARKLRADLSTRFAAMLETVDAMACPAGGAPAFPTTRAIQIGGIPDNSAAWEAALPRSAEFTMPMNLAGTPAICLPSGFSAEGLPYSIQFAGRRLSEPLLCRLAHAYEQATSWHTRHPAAFA
jgi:amidase